MPAVTGGHRPMPRPVSQKPTGRHRAIAAHAGGPAWAARPSALRRLFAALAVALVGTLGLAAPAHADGVGDISKALDGTQGDGFTAPSTFESGALVRYRLTLSCSSTTSDCGPSALTDVLDPRLTPVDVVLPQGTGVPLSKSISGQTVTVNVGTTARPWPDSSTLEIVIVARVNASSAGTIPNQATVRTNGGTTTSPVVNITVPEPTPEWGLDKRIAYTRPTTIAVGEYTGFAVNFTVPRDAVYGNVPITGGTLVDTYPAGAIPVDANGVALADGATIAPNGVLDLDTNTITWTLPRIDTSNVNCSIDPCLVTGWAPAELFFRFPSPAFAAGDTPINSVTADVTYADGSTETMTDTQAVTLQAATLAPVLSKSGPATIAAGGLLNWEVVTINSGNATATNWSLTDVLPTSGVSNLKLYGVYPGTHEPTNDMLSTVRFETTTDGVTWSPWFSWSAGDAFPVRDLPAGTTALRATASSLRPTYIMRFHLQGTATGDVGSVIKNCATLSGAGFTDVEKCVNTTVTAPFSQLLVYKDHVFADPGSTSVAPGDTFLWMVRATPTNGLAPSTMDFTDVLPAGFEYVASTCWYSYNGYYSGPSDARPPTWPGGSPTVPSGDACVSPQPASTTPVLTPQADGSTLMQWLDVPTNGTMDFKNGWYGFLGIGYTVRVKPGTSVANYTNTFHANTADGGSSTTCGTSFSNFTATDSKDFNANGSTTDSLCSHKDTVQVRQAAIADVFKWVKGDLDRNALESTGMPSATCPNLDGYTRYPCVAEVTRGGTFDYLFQHVNTGNVELTDFVMYDILPHVGDVGVNQVLASTQRGTDWTPVLTGPVTLDSDTVPDGANPVILYNLSYDPCRPELAQGTPGTNWQGATCADPTGGTNPQNTWLTEAQVTDWAAVKSFKVIMFDGERDYTKAWQPGDSIVAMAPMQAPAGTPESVLSPLNLSVAWNSMAHQVARLSTGGTAIDLLSAAPRKVGIIVPFPGVSVGDYVWFDKNHDGLQSPGEEPIKDVTVRLRNEAGELLSTTTTDADGYYSFQYLLPSTTYTIEFVAPDGLTFTTANANGVTSNDPVADNGTTALDGTTGGDSDAIVAEDGLTGVVTFTTPAKDGTENLKSLLAGGTVADNPGIDAGFVSVMNLKLAKELASEGPFFRGKTVTYTLTPSNDGPMDALAGWSVTDLAPEGMTITGMTGSGYTCSVAGDGAKGTCTATAGLPAESTGAVITVTATINADAELGSTQKNVAYVSPDAGDVTETVPLVEPELTTNTTTSTTDNDAQAELTLSNAVSVGDYVWYDINRDGIQGDSEPMVEDGMAVNLYAADGTTLVDSTTTVDGYYAFTDLTPSTAYVIEFVKPTGTTFTTQKVTTAVTPSATTANDSDADVDSGRTSIVTPDSGANLADPDDADDPTIDAGLVKYNLTLTKKLVTTGTINPGATVEFTLTPFNEGPVAALAGWTVTEVLPEGLTLVSMSGEGYTCTANVCTATQPLAGDKAGSPITVTAILDAQITNGTLKNVAYVDKAPADVSETNPLGTPPTTGTDTATSPTDNDAEAELSVTPLVSIGDYVWYDNNRDGIQNNDEPTYPNMTVQLLDDSGTVVRTTTTDADGYYAFGDLPPSTEFTVEFVLGAGETFTTQTVTSGGATTANDSNPDDEGLAPVTTTSDGMNRTAAGQADDPTIDAGVVKYNLVLTKELSSTGPVYAGSTVTFTLTPSNDGPATANTGWTVTEVLPTGLTLVSMTGDGYTYAGNVATATAPLAGGATGPVITVTATVDKGFKGGVKNVAYVDKAEGDVDETNPLGSELPTSSTDTATTPTDNDAEAPLTVDSLVSMGDYVWWDVNRDGVQDSGEAPVEGVTVTLYAADGTQVGTPATTDENGFYSFVDLTPGTSYYVIFTAPADTAFTTGNEGADDTKDSDANVATGRADFVAPASGSNSATTPDDPSVDAGLVQLNLTLAKELVTAGPFGSGDTVEFTLTPHNDGPVDALAGWSVSDLLPAGLTLVDITGDATAYTCDTATASCTATQPLAAGADGPVVTVTATIDAYTVGTLHNVAWVAPAGTDVAETNPLATPATDTDTDSTATDNDAQAALDLLPVSIGDYVWWDVNRDGLQSEGEAPVEGVTVTLYRVDGTTEVASAVTDANGFYSFTDLAPGADYVVVFTKPDGTSFTTPLAGAEDLDSNPNAGGVAPVHTPKDGANSATTPDDPTIDAGLVKLNLTLTKNLVSEGPFGAGDSVEFTLTPANDGPVDALAGWSVTDLLPTGLTLVDMVGDSEVYACDTTTATCTSLVPLAAGEQGAPITVTATIDGYTTGTLRNVAWVTPVDGDTPETNPLVKPESGTNTDDTDTDNDAQAELDLQAVSMGDYVWWDVNRDGLQSDGEAPVPGVTVTLYRADGTTQVGQTTTDSDGFYSFVDLAPGQAYVVVFTKPDGSTFTTQTVGSDVEVDSNADIATGQAAFVTPKSGTNSATEPDLPSVDAGLVQFNLTVHKAIDGAAGRYAPGNKVTFTLVPSNDGPVDALPGWSVTDVLPKGLTLVSITGDDYDCDAATVTCTSDSPLAAGGTGGLITVVATITATGDGTLRNVTYVSPAPDDTPETNPLDDKPGPDTDTSTTPTDNDSDVTLDYVTPKPEHLAHTGSSGLGMLVGSGVALTLLGALLAFSARRREEELAATKE